jgi:hypothetical protein
MTHSSPFGDVLLSGIECNPTLSHTERAFFCQEIMT